MVANRIVIFIHYTDRLVLVFTETCFGTDKLGHMTPDRYTKTPGLRTCKYLTVYRYTCMSYIHYIYILYIYIYIYTRICILSLVPFYDETATSRICLVIKLNEF